MVDTVEQIQYPGEVIIDSLMLYTSRTKLDVSNLTPEIDLFEDIYASVMHGSIHLYDSFNLLSNLPLLGEEYIEIAFHTPTCPTTISKRFAVLAIKDLKILSTKIKTYIIYFSSKESVVDLNSKVTKAYEGTPSSIAQNIFKTYFPSATLKVSESTNNVKHVGTCTPPFSFVNQIAAKAIDSTTFRAPTFLFYEDNQRFNFVSVNDLVVQAPVCRYKWNADQLRNRMSPDDGESVAAIQRAYENTKFTPKFYDIGNLVNRVDWGIQGSTTYIANSLNKNIKKVTYSYVDDFDKTKHLGSGPANSPNLIKTNDALIQSRMISPYTHDHIKDYDGEIAAKKVPILSQLELIKMDVTTFGRTDVKVGDVVEFDAGAFGNITDDNILGGNLIDTYYSGRYLVAAIQHRIILSLGKHVHEMNMQLVKDSFNEKLK